MRSSRELVLSVFLKEKNTKLSVSDIKKRIEAKGTYIDARTVVVAIDELKGMHWNIAESSERRGVLKIPVKVFEFIGINLEKITN